MKLGFASDHAGFDLKEGLKAWAIEQGHEVVDFGTDGSASVDYPDFAHRAAEGKDQWERLVPRRTHGTSRTDRKSVV